MKIGKAKKSLLLVQLLAFALLASLSWADEFLNIPAWFSGPDGTMRAWDEALLETSYVFIVAALSISISIFLFKRIQYLEGFISICANCKKVRIDKKWVPIEQFVGQKSEATFSHGICPICSKELYGISYPEE